MKIDLDLRILVGEEGVDADTFAAQIEQHRDEITDVASLEGAIIVSIEGGEGCGEYFDPILRLADQWVRKLPWILAGDTETVAFRNSEHCYAFVPAGESVEFSFFVGSESEIEEYVVEPTTIWLETFTNQSIAMGERVLELVRAVDPELLESNEDCKELTSSLEEARNAWKKYQLHKQR